MKITIRPFAECFVDAVHALNRRLREQGHRGMILPTSDRSFGPEAAAVGLAREQLLVVDGEEVRGGYMLKRQGFVFPSGECRSLGGFQMPVSEGVVDKAYAMVGPAMMLDILRREPLLYAVGPHPKFGRLLQSGGWRLAQVPFYFRIVRPTSFLRNITYLRGTAVRRFVLDLAATLRLASLPVILSNRLRDRHRRVLLTHTCDIEERFGDWADEVWEAARSAYSLIGVRNQANLNIDYPADKRFYRLRIRRDGKDVGWAVVMSRPDQGHKHFGSMRLGTLVDVLALPGSEAAVVRWATCFLESSGVDLIITNQSHRSWVAAIDQCGYLTRGRSLPFFASPHLVRALAPYDEHLSLIHMTRGDGDGPIGL